MDYLHLSTSDVANLKESWAVLEDNINKVIIHIIHILHHIPVRIYTEEKVKAVDAVWAPEFIQFLAR